MQRVSAEEAPGDFKTGGLLPVSALGCIAVGPGIAAMVALVGIKARKPPRDPMAALCRICLDLVHGKSMHASRRAEAFHGHTERRTETALRSECGYSEQTPPEHPPLPISCPSM